MKKEALLKLFDAFYAGMKKVFGALPLDLEYTLQDIRDYIKRNAK